MSRARQLIALSATAMLALGLTACSSEDNAEPDAAPGDAGSAGAFEPITIEHAFGTTTIEEKPERVATVAWANQEVPLALGVVPVGMAAANFADPDGDGMLPWATERLEELGGEQPVLFDEGDGIDFEAVANTEPDVILAAYSGLTQADYDTLSKIAPVVAYPENAWGTDWREMIELNSAGMGVPEEGAQLITDLEEQMAESVAAHPELEGRSVAFMTHVDATDLSEVSFYSTHDTRVEFFEDLGLSQPQSILDASAESEEFAITVSAEQADVFDDIDIIVTYGDEAMIEALQADPVLSQIPAVANDAIVALTGDNPLGTAANPTPLAISWVLDDYLDLLAEAAGKGQ
jgi:iron complex transport system substrate-binding protein